MGTPALPTAETEAPRETGDWHPPGGEKRSMLVDTMLDVVMDECTNYPSGYE